jgi:hypothetical protein
MPVLLMPEDCRDARLGSTSPRALLRAYELDRGLRCQRAVNSVKNDTEVCIEPIDDA